MSKTVLTKEQLEALREMDASMSATAEVWRRYGMYDVITDPADRAIVDRRHAAEQRMHELTKSATPQQQRAIRRWEERHGIFTT